MFASIVASLSATGKAGLARWTRHRTFWAIFLLALAFRLLALLLFRPGGYIADAGDFEFYYLWGLQLPKGYETFVNLWTAYPPLFPALMLPIFEWSSRIPPWVNPTLFFHLLFGLLLLLFESGNILLIYRLANRLGYGPLDRDPSTAQMRGHSDPPQTTNLIHPLLFYCLLFTPVYTLLGWFEAMPLFFMLWGLDLLLSAHRPMQMASAAVAALGFLTKLTPALLVPIAIRWLGSRLSWQAARNEWFRPRAQGNLFAPLLYTLLFLGVVVVGGYWLVGGHTELAFSSLRINALRPPWESVWALVEGNYDWGRVPIDMRNLVALGQPATPGRLPWGWITFAFALLYLWLYTRQYDWANPRTPVVFAAVSVGWLFLYSKGWSPQFLVWILAFVALLLPTWQGIGLSVGLSVLNVIESPIFFTIFGNERWMLAGIILLRTALLIALLVTLLGQIWPTTVRRYQLQRVGSWATATLLGLTVLGIGGALPRAAQAYSAQRLALHPCRTAIEYLREQAHWPERQILSDQVEIWRDLYPWLHSTHEIRVIDGYDALDRPWAEVIAERLAEQAGSEPFWWVTYIAGADRAQPSRAERYFARPDVQLLDQEERGQCQVARVMRAPAEPLATAQVTGGPIALVNLFPTAAKVGEPFHLVIYWQAKAPVQASYTVFVHLLDAAGQLVAQQDNLPVMGLAPTETWQPGQLIRDPYQLTLPPNLSPGTYQLQVGLYTAAGRVPFARGDGELVEQVSATIEVQ